MESVKRYYVGRYGYVVSAADFDRVSAENLALQQRLTVQDQRVEELEGLLRRAKPYIPKGRWGSVPYQWHLEVDDAIKPNAEAVKP